MEYLHLNFSVTWCAKSFISVNYDVKLNKPGFVVASHNLFIMRERGGFTSNQRK